MAILRSSGFVALRRGLLEHVSNGTMSLMEYSVFTMLLILAAPESGIWHGSAGLMATLFNINERTTRDLLEKLERKGYLKRFPVRGKHGSYPILIHRYFCSVGAVKGKSLNASSTTTWERPVYEVCDENVNDGVDDGAGKYLETKKQRERTEAVEGSKPPSQYRLIEPFQESSLAVESASVPERLGDKLEALPLAEFAKVWNEQCGPLARIQGVSDSRRRKIRARVSAGMTVKQFAEVVQRCAATPFLSGRNDRGWKADFDWLIANDTNAMKVLEGKYGEPDRSQAISNTAMPSEQVHEFKSTRISLDQIRAGVAGKGVLSDERARN